MKSFYDYEKIQHDFKSWLAGIVDGDGNFDFRGTVLKAIRIKIHVRDVRILKHIQSTLHIGRIKHIKSKPYVMYIVSSKPHMSLFVLTINGHIRVKVPRFEKACVSLGLEATPAGVCAENDAYFAGLVDSDGWVVYNYPQNCITVGVEVNMSCHVEKLNFDNVICGAKPNCVCRKTASGKTSLRFVYQSVATMGYVLDYFLKQRLYSDLKFYRVTQIKRFLQIRHYQSYAQGSIEHRIYSSFMINFIAYKNPQWAKVPFVAKLDKDIVHKSTL